MIGLVLCGGHSKRMNNKTLLPRGDGSVVLSSAVETLLGFEVSKIYLADTPDFVNTVVAQRSGMCKSTPLLYFSDWYKGYMSAIATVAASAEDETICVVCGDNIYPPAKDWKSIGDLEPEANPFHVFTVRRVKEVAKNLLVKNSEVWVRPSETFIWRNATGSKGLDGVYRYTCLASPWLFRSNFVRGQNFSDLSGIADLLIKHIPKIRSIDSEIWADLGTTETYKNYIRSTQWSRQDVTNTLQV